MSRKPGANHRPGPGRRFRPQAATPGAAGRVAADPNASAALTPADRVRLPAMSRCVGCGLCALVAGRAGRARLPDLAGAYLRDPFLLGRVASDLAGEGPGPAALAAASALCPVGVPLDQAAALARRMAGSGDPS